MKIRKGDKVKVIKGKDRGREGVVSRVWPREGKVLVAGVNVYKKHVKRKGNTPGGIVEVERPLAVANVMLVCSRTGKPARVGYTFVRGRKVRLCKGCGEILVAGEDKK